MIADLTEISFQFPVAVTDVCPIVSPLVTTEVTVDHASDQDASFTSSFKLDSPTEMPAELNLVADDHEPMDTTADMTAETRIVQCSESSVLSTKIPDDSGMERSSSTEHITSEVQAISCHDEPSLILDIVEDKDVSMEQLLGTVPEQVANELETTCCRYIGELDEPLLNLDIVEKDTSSGKTVMSKIKKPTEPLQQLKIAPRNYASTDSFRIESVCELRPSLSFEEQEDTRCEAKDKVAEDGYFQQPQPPGNPPVITGWRLIKSLEPKVSS